MAGIKGKTNKPVDGKARNINLTIRFTEEEIAEINKISKILDIPKTRLVRNLALTGLDNAKILNATGILKGTKKLIDFKERLSNAEKYQTLPGIE